jgi:type II secretory pathway pseudopilin PulG
MKRSQSGFTVIEIILVVLFLATAAIVLFIQRSNLAAAERDTQRKTAINAMYYDLQEVFYAKNGYYPATIDEKNLTAMDPSLFKDPNGVKIGEEDSEYRYETTGCDNDKCKGFTLRANLEKEDDFVKSSSDK